jgi:Zn-dependent protease
MAYHLGDPTAKYAGRLTLNPIKHLDPIGSVLLPLFLILSGSSFLVGWAKPVPINPYNFKDQKYGSAKSAIAGPAANLAIALFFGLLLRFLPFSGNLNSQILFSFFAYIVQINLILAIFNLIPIPPLDGSHILFSFLPYSMENTKIFLNKWGMFILMILIFFVPEFFNILSQMVGFMFRVITGA